MGDLKYIDSKELLDPNLSTSDFFVVGIGASAGGLEAIEQFFSQMNSKSGLAFIIVQHLSDQYKSFMPELLSKHTEMDIVRAEEGMTIKPNCIYLNPPHTSVTINNGKLHLSSIDPKKDIYFPIDTLLTSLAKEKKEKAIGIVFSGKGSDGTLGVKAIHESGGLVLIQSKDTAKFQDMPQSAEETGIVDFILPPVEMPGCLNHYCGYKRIELEENELEKIFILLKKNSGIDFSLYKKNSVMRRIERRVNLYGAKCSTLKQYRELLQQNQKEITKLQNDLLIGVTHFFRDIEAFEILKKEVLPQIFQYKRKKREHEIRIWVAGCSTGQEAYSLAILFKEYMDEIKEDFKVRIFATDLDKESIKMAMQGVFDESIVATLTQERIVNYFEQIEGNFKVKKEIRDMIVFAPHNIAKDSPFVHLDFISCRNMMIYFQPELQKKVLSLFHFALNKNGFLFLGPSETIGKLSNLFEVIHSKWKIFRYVENNEWDMSNTFGVSKYAKKEYVSRETDLYDPYLDSKSYLQKEKIYQKIIEHYTSPCFLVNERDEIIVSCGNVIQYLKVPKGESSFNLYKMVQTDLSVAIATALKKVRREKKEINYANIVVKQGNIKKTIHLTAKPFDYGDGLNALTLILFEESTVSNGDSLFKDIINYEPELNVNERIIDLEEELHLTQQNLQTTIEELETSNEELQSTNEELIAANEELQSTNEELQSVNEELINVNGEYELKINELTDLNNDMDNLLISTNIATVFLDRELKVKRFTPEATKVINLLDIDIGRPFFHISHNLNYDELINDAQSVLDYSCKVHREVRDKQGRWYSIRMMPYRTTENFIFGVVLTFIDITEVKKVNEDLKITSFALEQSPANILITNANGKIEYVNYKFTSLYGFVARDVINEKIEVLYEEMMKVKHFKKIWNTIKRGRKWTGELSVQDKFGNKRWESVSFTPILDENGDQIQILRIAEDITERKQAEEVLKQSEMLSAMGQLAAGIAHEIRNPLTSLKGFLQLMDAEGNYNPTYGKVMIKEFERIETIVSELLLLARPQDIQYDFCDLSQTVKDVALLLETQAIMKSIKIEVEIKSIFPKIRCIENELKQVFINLVKNSIEAMPDGGEIYIKMDVVRDEQLVIQIVDNGNGIPKERLKRLGQPFYTTKEKGTGLGLMVSFKIIENHGGQIRFESQEGQGTIVTMKLPIV